MTMKGVAISILSHRHDVKHFYINIYIYMQKSRTLCNDTDKDVT